jgi:hypothetical protein
LTQVRLFDVGRAGGDDTAALDEMLAGVAQRLVELSEELARRYFSHTDTPQQLVRIV